MRKSAQEYINNLEARIARLEKQSSSRAITELNDWSKLIKRDYQVFLEDVVYVSDNGIRENQKWSKSHATAMASMIRGRLLKVIIETIRAQLESMKAKTQKELLILKRFVPNHTFLNVYTPSMYDENVWDKIELVQICNKFEQDCEDGKFTNILLEKFISDATRACQKLGI